MELYHQTLLRPVQALHALAAHLLPIKPKEEQEKPKQVVIARTCSLELNRRQPLKFKNFGGWLILIRILITDSMFQPTR